MKLTEKKISKNDYAVVSKPSLMNKAEAGGVDIDNKLNSINLSPSKRDKDQKDTLISEIEKKLTQTTTELNDMKVDYQIKMKELDQLHKENQELKEYIEN